MSIASSGASLAGDCSEPLLVRGRSHDHPPRRPVSEEHLSPPTRSSAAEIDPFRSRAEKTRCGAARRRLVERDLWNIPWASPRIKQKATRIIRPIHSSVGAGHKGKNLAAPHCYSITSSARPSSVSGKVMPSALAVFMLMISWIFVSCWTGRSEGFSPLRIRPV
jgi:hypothetical protein